VRRDDRSRYRPDVDDRLDPRVLELLRNRWET
jgi:hypothetical protein